MKLQQLKYIWEVSRHNLNVTATAESLFTSQPGISKQIRMLEDEIGLQIFRRSGKHLTEITPVGKKIIAFAGEILDKAENIRQVALEFSDEQRGSLSIATTHTQARYVLPPVIQKFRERYPKVKLNLHQGTSEQIADMMATTDIDFAIATGSNELFKSLLLIPAYRWDRKILVPHDHELTTLHQDISLQDLAKHPLVSYVFSFGGESSLKRAFSEYDLRPDVVFTARDADVIKTYVRMGLGVGIVASMAIQSSDSADLTTLDAPGLFPRSTTWVGFRKNVPMRRYMSEFVQLFAPHVDNSQLRAATIAQRQQEVDSIFAGANIPLRNGCDGSLSVAA
jgi:LysR family cys regulon transcriptional activator